MTLLSLLVEPDVQLGQLVQQVVPDLLVQGAQGVAAAQVEVAQLVQVGGHQVEMLPRDGGVLVQVQARELPRALQDLGQAARREVGAVQRQGLQGVRAVRDGQRQAVVHVDAVEQAELAQVAEALRLEDEVRQLGLVQPGVVVAPREGAQPLQALQRRAQRRGRDVRRDPDGQRLPTTAYLLQLARGDTPPFAAPQADLPLYPGHVGREAQWHWHISGTPATKPTQLQHVSLSSYVLLPAYAYLELRALRHGVQHGGAGHAGRQPEHGQRLGVAAHHVRHQPVQAVDVEEAQAAHVELRQLPAARAQPQHLVRHERDLAAHSH